MTHGTNDLKTTTDAPISPLIRPFQEFAARQASGGILLLLCTAAALVWVNSPWAQSYEALWHTKLILRSADQTLDHDLHFCVNDGLMAIFFVVVGLEIKRELLVPVKRGQARLPRAPALLRAIPRLRGDTLATASGPGESGPWSFGILRDIVHAPTDSSDLACFGQAAQGLIHRGRDYPDLP